MLGRAVLNLGMAIPPGGQNGSRLAAFELRLLAPVAEWLVRHGVACRRCAVHSAACRRMGLLLITAWPGRLYLGVGDESCPGITR